MIQARMYVGTNGQDATALERLLDGFSGWTRYGARGGWWAQTESVFVVEVMLDYNLVETFRRVAREAKNLYNQNEVLVTFQQVEVERV